MFSVRSIAIFTLASIAAQALAAAPPDIPAADLEKIRAAAPHDVAAKPKSQRKVLVFSRALGYYHDSIPWGAAAIRVLGEKTGAYTATLSDDPAVFDRQGLSGFDAVVMNNNCGNAIPDATHRANLLEFVRAGGGLVGIHCAAHVDWPEFIDLLGGYSKDHPWTEGSTVTVKLEEADHPLVRCFAASSFQHTDEIFRFERFSRDKVRVLLSLDTARTDMRRPGIVAGEDYPLGWIRTYGKGHVFYCALGHGKDIFWQSPVLRHYLAGIQFALGDLEADAAPKGNR